MRQPLNELINSAGFTQSNSARVRSWTTKVYTPELKMFVDVMRQSQQFIEDVRVVRSFTSLYLLQYRDSLCGLKCAKTIDLWFCFSRLQLKWKNDY